MWKKTKRKLADLIRSASFTEVGVALDYSANWQTREECDRNGNPYPDWTDRPGEFLTIYKTRGSQDTEVGGKAPEVGPKSEEVGGKAQVLEPTDTAFKNAMRLGAKFLL